MGKLGKKARKFARKNLQSVLKRQRKNKSVIRKRSSSRDGRDAAEDQVAETTELSNGRNIEGGDIEETSLDAIFSEDDSDVAEDDSDSDGFLSEDSSSMHVAESENESYLEDGSGDGSLLKRNREKHLELARQNKKLDRLKKKDPKFSKFLESYNKGVGAFRNEEIYSDEDEDETSNDAMQSVNGDSSKLSKGMLLTNSVINSLCQLATEQHTVSALTSLLNGYRAACHYGTESAGVLDDVSYRRFQNSETFCDILIFMLREAG
ncbi:hypothetical protein L1049_011113 [Liquidambar formosana]|uniref:FHA domain-containing protein n=1 Tax=Liquidambar formosana TaxID=63359 RepID=A0AAP0RR01_LIQFO